MKKNRVKKSQAKNNNNLFQLKTLKVEWNWTQAFL